MLRGLALLAGWFDIMYLISSRLGVPDQLPGLYFFDFPRAGGGAARAPKDGSQNFSHFLVRLCCIISYNR